MKMRKAFNPENFDLWLEYYANQASQSGYGMVGFKGFPYQRGAGLGSFFRSLFRMAVPLFKSAATSVGKEALASGANIASDLVQGRSLGESLEERGREGAVHLVQKLGEKLQKGRGLGIRPTSIKGIDDDVFHPKQTKSRKNGSN